MEDCERLIIPPESKEAHVWHIDDDEPVSRSRRSRGNGPYESAVPAHLAKLRITIPASLAAESEDAAAALARFDSYSTTRLGAGSHALGPMSAVLLRTEATSSSQIEHLTVGRRIWHWRPSTRDQRQCRHRGGQCASHGSHAATERTHGRNAHPGHVLGPAACAIRLGTGGRPLPHPTGMGRHRLPQSAGSLPCGAADRSDP